MTRTLLFSGLPSVQVQFSLGLSCRIRALWVSDSLAPPRLALQLDWPGGDRTGGTEENRQPLPPPGAWDSTPQVGYAHQHVDNCEQNLVHSKVSHQLY